MHKGESENCIQLLKFCHIQDLFSVTLCGEETEYHTFICAFITINAVYTL